MGWGAIAGSEGRGRTYRVSDRALWGAGVRTEVSATVVLESGLLLLSGGQKRIPLQQLVGGCGGRVFDSRPC